MLQPIDIAGHKVDPGCPCFVIAKAGVNHNGDIQLAESLIDDYAEGKTRGIVDLLLVGKFDQYHLKDLIRKTERYVKRKIRKLAPSRMNPLICCPSQKKGPQLLT